MNRTQTGLMVTGAGPETHDTSRWTRLKGAAFLTVVGAAVVVAMIGWLGGLALIMLDLYAALAVS